MGKLESFLLCFPDVNSQSSGRVIAISCGFKENHYYYFDTELYYVILMCVYSQKID